MKGESSWAESPNISECPPCWVAVEPDTEPTLKPDFNQQQVIFSLEIN